LGGLDDDPLSFLSDYCVLAGQLGFARNSDDLNPSVLEEFDVSFIHPFLMASASAYAAELVNRLVGGRAPSMDLTK
jgi:hypothetical protein